MPTIMNTATAFAIFTRDGDAARDFASRVNVGHGRNQRADPGAARLSHLRRVEEVHVRRPEPARPRFNALLYEDKDGDIALAGGVKEGAEFVNSDDEIDTKRGGVTKGCTTTRRSTTN